MGSVYRFYLLVPHVRTTQRGTIQKIQRIRNIREKINKHLDTLEIRLKEELSQLETKAENDIQGTLKRLKEKKSTECQRSFFQSSIESGRFDKVEIAFELDENINDFSNINKFGSVQLQKIPSSLQFDSQKGKQAQTIEIGKSIENIVVKFIDSLQVNTTGESIYGCDYLPDGNMVFCNYSTKQNGDSISVFASNGRYLDKILLKPNYAFDIVSLDEKTVAVISDNPESSGIAVDGIGNIYVTNQDLNNVIIISLDGKQRKQLLSKSGGLDKPRAIQYDRKQNRLLVANTTGKAFLFDISH
ncbi:CD91 [Mytilus edulis]|uniref:LRP1 n=1 Tax=Mytilus edulis TaxID=6550 RepID=A0A8S3STW5_MYTED|nr:CD91 [Mytilus edulis]